MIFAIGVFLGTYVWLASEKTPRYVVALSAATLLILGRVFTLSEAMREVNWDTMALIFGMFTLVAALSESGFFHWLALTIARRLRYNPVAIFLAFPLLAALLSMVLDNITVMLFLTTLTLELCAYVPIDPALLITAEVCAANTGGGATLIGAPPNVIMGTTLGYGFNSFLVHMAPSVWICTFVMVGVFYFVHRRHLRSVRVENQAGLAAMDLSQKITNPALLWASLGALGAAIALLILHPVLEGQWHIPMTVGLAALLPALGLMIYEDRHGREVLRSIDLESLLFFMALFVIVGALDKVGALRALSRLVLAHTHNPVLILLLFLWFAAIASAFVDNVPMALSMAYLIKGMNGIPGAPPQGMLVWASLMGLLMGGNMTPIGASPNVVAYGILEKKQLKIGWKKWAQLTVPATVSALAAGSFLMWFKYAVGWY